MPSPFPGMDPYLESPAVWRDFHSRFVNAWCEAVADALPDHYDARIDERVNLIEVPEERVRRRFDPDVAVEQLTSSGSGGVAVAPAGVAVLEPVTISLLIEDETRETYIEILHRPERSLVAVLELLSPANKEEPGRGLYLLKRNCILQHPIHLIELDLLVKGQRPPFEQDLPADDYYCFLSHGDRRPKCDVYHWAMRQPLPGIPIPLLPPDPDVWVDLAAVFRTTYERGRYARSLNYAGPPPVSLPPEQKEWAERQARAAAK